MLLCKKYWLSVGVLFFLSVSYAHSAAVLFFDDFETGFGNWNNVTTGDNKNWNRDYGGTPSSGTGPITGGNGSNYYVYLETSSGSAYNFGDTAILQSPPISAANVHLKFQYHMYGANMGTLAVDVFSGGVWTNNVWTISGQQQTSNNAAYMDVNLDLSAYAVAQLRFRATAAGSYRGDMALDNIEISSIPTGPVAPTFTDDPLSKSSAVQHQPYSDNITADAIDSNGDAITFNLISGPTWLTVATDGALSGTPSSSDVGLNSFVVEASDGSLSSQATLNINVTDGSEPIVLSNSDFEVSYGDWVNVSIGDNKNWTRDASGTPSSGTGPFVGGNGSNYYVYLETSSGSAYTAGDTAILQGPTISGSNINLKFQYHMYGADIGSLAVDVFADGIWTNDVWYIAGQQQTSNGAAYTDVDLDLSAYTVSQLRFRAIAAGSYRGDIALDNIIIESTNLVASDSDNDGVLDGDDQCPNTPSNETADANGCSASQIDTDNDGVPDVNDAFPSDPAEWLDTDVDGIGNNADTDDDNDGVLDVNDALPLDSTESVDTDGDGIGNNADTDDDNDGVLDVNDAFPQDVTESVDTDSDGIGNNADTDDDNDGVLDVNDALPLDSTESVDTDGDGIGNNADTDDDNDGVNDLSDAFPLDDTESVDTDGDGIGNNADTDDDNDGLSDLDETGLYGTDPLLADSDTDGMPDGWEVQNRLSATTNDASGDLDGDGISNLDEFLAATDPSPPIVTSTTPSNQITNVSVNAILSVDFSEAIDASSVTSLSFIVNDGVNDIAGSHFVNGANVTFTPDQILQTNTVYSASVTQAITDLAGNSLGADYQWAFTTQNSYTVSGNVTSSALALDGVSLDISGPTTGSVVSDSNGQFIFADFAAGNYTVTPSLLGYVFMPSSIDITITDSNITGIDFEANTIPVVNVPGDYATIQLALDGALPGATILVADGVYTENLVINNAVTLESANGYATTEIIAANTGQHVISVNAANVTIKGFDISGAHTYYRSAIYFATGSDNGKALDNRCGYDDLHRNYIGIAIYGSNNMQIDNNSCNHWGPFGIYVDTSTGSSFTNNSIADHGFEGINLVNCSSCTVSGNTITRTRTGIYLRNTDGSTVANNDSSANTQHGIHVLNSGSSTLSNNIAGSNTQVGLYVESSGATTITGNTTSSNSVSGLVVYASNSSTVSLNTSNSNAAFGIYLNGSSSCRVDGNNTVANNHTGIKLNYADNNEVIGNYSSANKYNGIEVDFSTGNLLTENIARTKSSGLVAYGIYMRGASNNAIYLNQFENFSNGASVRSDNSASNSWVSPTQQSYIYNSVSFTGLMGNYYNDHVLVDSDNDGITDTDAVLPGSEPAGAFPMVAPLSAYQLQ